MLFAGWTAFDLGKESSDCAFTAALALQTAHNPFNQEMAGTFALLLTSPDQLLRLFGRSV